MLVALAFLTHTFASPSQIAVKNDKGIWRAAAIVANSCTAHNDETDYKFYTLTLDSEDQEIDYNEIPESHTATFDSTKLGSSTELGDFKGTIYSAGDSGNKDCWRNGAVYFGTLEAFTPMSSDSSLISIDQVKYGTRAHRFLKSPISSTEWLTSAWRCDVDGLVSSTDGRRRRR